MNGSSPTVAAFFDVDRTLIAINSGRRWLLREWSQGQLSWRELVQSFAWLLQYRLGWLDFQSCAQASLLRYRGRNYAEVQATLDAFAKAELVPRICRQAQAALAMHRAQGHLPVLLTSGTALTVAPLAEHLAIADVICTELQVVDGRLSGSLVPPICFGHGKVERAQLFAGARGVDLQASYFYSDSATDLPMFDCVGHVRVINPDLRLRLLARRRGWMVERWSV